MAPQHPQHHILHRLTEATEEIDADGEPDAGSNKAAVFSAESYVIPGYYPNDRCHYVGVDLEDEQFLHSMSGTVQSVLSRHGLMYNYIDRDRFDGYREETEPIEHDYIFHVVDVTWLPEKWL